MGERPSGTQSALIVGISGQDGCLLAELLLEKGYAVHGTTRRPPGAPVPNAIALGIADRLVLHSCDLSTVEALAELLQRLKPDEIYYLAAQSSVARSFAEPVQTWEASATGLVRLLAAADATTSGARIVYAASGDCFGETDVDGPATERSPFAPRSPYAAAKCAAHQAISAARVAGRFACSAFLFSHESVLRPETFAIGKVVAAVRRIAAGSPERVPLGDVNVVRDWGWAPEFVDGLWRMARQETPRDFLIATGRSHSLAEFVELAFASTGLDWRRHVDVGAVPSRPADIARQYADPGLARDILGWSAEVQLPELARRLVARTHRAA